MLLKRSTIKTHHLILPALALLGLTACNSDDPSEPAPAKAGPKTEGIALTIPLSSSATGENTESINDRLTIVAYDDGGHLIETIYQNGDFVEGWSGKGDMLEVDNYGTVMSVMLPNEKYEQYTIDDRATGGHYGIHLVAFYLPTDGTKFNGEEDFNAPDDLSELNSKIKENYILNFPADGDGYWKEADEMNIPMAGSLELTSAVQNYDPILWNENNPMFLNNDPLMLIRSMAKVTIKSEDNFITDASFTTANHGTLLSENVGSDGKVTAVTLPTDESATGYTSFFKEPTLIQKSNGEDNNSFVFYTFERDLTNSNNKDLIEVFWDGHGSKKFDFKPTSPADESKNEWQGILRNHSYTFTVKKPENSDIQVEVKVKEWEPDRYSVDL
ncbi:MAG: fimbrillin family protein [Muribaculaceae bacterium]|nr:fimbrillin family protein [Muribaculaceae bacterium]